MDKRIVWNYLVKSGMTPEGAAGMMGNLQAESGIIPNRVETKCLNRYKEQGKIYTDATYTAFVNDGTISKAEFLRPMGKQYGYGLAQWTSPGRKEGLYDLCKKLGVSIGDPDAQLQYLIIELKNGYQSVWKTLTSTNDVRTASNAVLMKFEMPADQGTAVQNTRYSYSKAIYDEMHTSDVSADDIISVMAGWIGYSEANGKHRQIVDIYNGYGASHGYPRGYKVSYNDAWCDVAVSAAFIKAGAVGLIGGVECGVEEHIAIFKQKGIWTDDGNITPKPGYIIAYNWNDSTQPNDGYADHIGLVESVSGKTITVIEGNYDDQVKRRSIPVGWGYIRGYAMPAYTEQPAADRYVVRRRWSEKQYQLGAFHKLENAKNQADENWGFRVYDLENPNKAIYKPKLARWQKLCAACVRLNQWLLDDIEAKKDWRYYNSGHVSESTFWLTRKAKKFFTNCMGGVAFAMKESGLPASACSWYGQKGGGIRWLNSHAEADLRKYADLIKIGDRTPRQLVADGTLCPGDILTFVEINHTCIYLGNGLSYDSGHAYCIEKGEGAHFIKWIGLLSWPTYHVGYIIRLKG